MSMKTFRAVIKEKYPYNAGWTIFVRKVQRSDSRYMAWSDCAHLYVGAGPHERPTAYDTASWWFEFRGEIKTLGTEHDIREVFIHLTYPPSDPYYKGRYHKGKHAPAKKLERLFT